MTCGRRAVDRGQGGSGVLLAMVVTSTLLALGLGLVALSSTERALAANNQAGAEALYGAEAVAEYALTELASDPSWSPALSGERHSAFLEPTGQPLSPWNEVLNLSAMTQRVQQQADLVWSAGSDTPQWRTFAAGSLSALVGSGLGAAVFVAVWVADDVADGDGDPDVDSNGIVMVRAQGLGLGAIQRSVHIVLRRENLGEGEGESPLVRIASWREIR